MRRAYSMSAISNLLPAEPSLEDFDIHSIVGEGEFGRVVLVSNRLDPTELLAMKVIRKENLLL